MAYRIDRGEAQGYQETEDGFLLVKGTATRTGVLRYKNPDGTYRHELRHPDDVINPMSLQTLAGVPLTIEHPPVLLNPQNVGQYQVGAISNRVQATDDGFVEVVLNVHRGDAIDYLKRGRKRMLSCGYRCDVAEEQGEFEGQRYTHRQRNIRYNHVCLTDDGRAGDAVRVAMDSLVSEGEDVAIEESLVAEPVPTVNWNYYGDSRAMGTKSLTVKAAPTVTDQGFSMDMDDMPMSVKTKVVNRDGMQKYHVTMDMGDYEEELEVDREAFDAFKKAYDSMQGHLKGLLKDKAHQDSLIQELEGDLNTYTSDIARKDSLIEDLEAENQDLRKRLEEARETYDSRIQGILETFDADDEGDDWEEDEDDEDLELSTAILDMDDEDYEEDEDDEDLEMAMDMDDEDWESDADDEDEDEDEDEDDEEDDEEYEDDEDLMGGRIDSLIRDRHAAYEQYKPFLGGERFDATVAAEEWLHRAAAMNFDLSGTETEAELRGMLRGASSRTDSGSQQLQELSALLGQQSRSDSFTARERMIRRELERSHANY